MAQKRYIITEYIVQIREDLPGTCVHKKAENIVRGYDCEYLSIPRSEKEAIMCKLHNIETSPNCFCCWAKRMPYPKDYFRGNSFLEIEHKPKDFIDEWVEEYEREQNESKWSGENNRLYS